MTWSYSKDPATSDKDAVRFLIQDTVSTDQQFQDEEIEYLLAQEGVVSRAAIRGAETLAMKYARMVDQSVGQVRKSFSQRAKMYQDLVKELSRRASLQNLGAFAGGISHAQKDLQEQDNDRVEPSFERDLHDLNKRDPRDADEFGVC